jgi:hypothetical protein
VLVMARSVISVLLFVAVFSAVFVIPFVSAFDFSSFFRNHGRSSSDDDERQSSGKSSAGGGVSGGRCDGFLCEFIGGRGVTRPQDCGCREGQYRCAHGPGSAFSCVASKEACDRLTARLPL